jgi:uncharacterized protein with beta-barrel porin domain
MPTFPRSFFLAPALMFLSALLPFAHGADTLDVTGDAGASTQTFNLDGASGTYAVGKITPATEPAVRVVGGANTIHNRGEINGTVAVENGSVAIYNYGGAKLGIAGEDYAITGLGELEPPASGASTLSTLSTLSTSSTTSTPSTEPAFTNVAVHNYGDILGGVAGNGNLTVNNYGGATITGTGAEAVYLSSGNATVNNSGAITATQTAVQIGDGAAPITGATGDAASLSPASMTLNNRGVINGDIVNNGTLNIASSSGAINGDVVNGGTLNLGANHFAFTGDYSGAASAAGATTTTAAAPTDGAARAALHLTVTNGGHGQMRVNGAADLSTTDLVVDANGGLAGEDYAVVTASDGLITSAGDDSMGVKINDHSLTLDYNYIISPSDVGVGNVAIHARATPQAFHHYASTREKEMGAQLDVIAANPQLETRMAQMLRRLNALTDAVALANALDSLNNRQTLNAQSQTSALAINSHLNAFRQLLREMSAGELYRGGYAAPSRASAGGADFARWQTFGRIYGAFGKERASGANVGYDFGNIGVLAALDYAFTKELRAGALVGFSYNRAELNQNHGKGVDYLTRFGAYANYNWDGIYVDAAPSVGWHQMDFDRKWQVGDASGTAKSDYAAWDFNLLLNAGYTVHLPARIYLTPELTLAPTVFYSPEYTESGDSLGANLTVAQRTTWSLLQVLQVKTGMLINLGGGTQLRPEISIGWEHEYADSEAEVETAFASAPAQKWHNQIATISSDRLLIGAGVSVLVGADLNLFLRWQQRWWEGGYVAEFNAGAGYSF